MLQLGDMTCMSVYETDLGGWRFVHHRGEGFDRSHGKRVQPAFKDLIGGNTRQSTDMANSVSAPSITAFA